MKTYIVHSVLGVILCVLPCKAVADSAIYKDKRQAIDLRVADLLKRMTLDEKIAELNLQPYYANTDSIIRAGIQKGAIGALLKANGAKLNKSLQKEAMKHSRLGIPLIFHEDVIHGYRTLSPIPLAESCSWDTLLVRKVSSAAAEEAAAAGIQLTYAPMVDISNDPRWGRIMETSGEDAFLGSMMARARVQGFQGDDLSLFNTLAACVKHFAGYGALLGGRDYLNTDFSYRDLIERYLPPFQAAVDAGVSSVMCSYTSYDGEPVTLNHEMNTEILRKRMGFRGLYMSDWSTMNHVQEEGAAKDGKEAAVRSLNSGLEMDMASGQFSKWLKELVLSGDVDSVLLDSAVAHALTVKFKLGLFDDPYKYFDEKRERKIIGSDKIKQVMYEMACASMVLLKNENSMLPLKREQKIALVGPFVNMKNDLMGSWTMQGKAEEVISVLDGFKEKMPVTQIINAGCAWNGLTQDYIDKIADQTKDASVIIACIGEFSYNIGEAVTTGKLQLPQEQIEMLKTLRATGKPIVTVLFNGRPLVLDKVIENSDALLEAWYPGTMGGKAVASLLLGDVNPSGKLTQTFPRHVGQVPVAYNFRRTFGRVEHNDIEEGPQFPFGFGLSYTTFEYGKPQTDRSVYNLGDIVRVNVKIVNTGKVSGREVVQLYIKDEVASIIPREKELKGFLSVEIPSGESRIVTFELPSDAFMIYNKKMEKVLEPGSFKIMIGGCSDKLQCAEISFR